MSQLEGLSDDLIALLMKDRFTVSAGPIMRSVGWRGGQWVQYVTPTGVDDFVVEKSDGNNVAGFMLFASENYGPGQSWGSVNNYTAGQVRLTGATTVSMINGGGRFLTRLFETTALGGGGLRNGGPAVYVLNEYLKISENGLICNDPDGLLALAGVTSPKIVAICCALPATRTGDRLGFDIKF